jgi:hypothetical protein
MFPSSRLGQGAVALVVSAFLPADIARRRQPRHDPTAVATTAAIPPRTRTRCAAILLIDLGEHLDRSQRTRRARDRGRRGGGLRRERNSAEQLVWANRLYRETAAATGDSSVVDLLDQLERVLVEVAASSPNSSQRELDDVRRRIESGSLLFKVRVVSSDLLERRRAVMRQTGQRSSL